MSLAGPIREPIRRSQLALSKIAQVFHRTIDSYE
jgi:hypothetical protein